LAADFEDYSFIFPGESESKRQAYRVAVRGLSIRIDGREEVCPVVDVSATGLAFVDRKQSLSLGENIRLDLYIKNRVWQEKIAAKIVRIWNQGMTACVFEHMTKYQEQSMDKLTLEIQKRLIDQRKRTQQQEDHDR